MALRGAMPSRVSLTELQLAGVRLLPAEAAAIVVEICRQHEQGRLRGVPSANVIRFTDDGGVVAEGPINADGPVVEAAAQLLDDLLPGFESSPELRAPGGLRLAVARALGTLDLPPFESLTDFAASIERFALPDLYARPTAVRGGDEGSRGSTRVPFRRLRGRGCRAVTDPRLTISDRTSSTPCDGYAPFYGIIRENANPDRPPSRTRVGILQELAGRLVRPGPVVRYARAAGLDEQVVVQVAQPISMPSSPNGRPRALRPS